MTSSTRDVLMRMAAFEHVQSLQQVHDHLTTNELKPGFVFEGSRIPYGESTARHLQAITDAILAIDQDRFP